MLIVSYPSYKGAADSLCVLYAMKLIDMSSWIVEHVSSLLACAVCAVYAVCGLGRVGWYLWFLGVGGVGTLSWTPPPIPKFSSIKYIYNTYMVSADSLYHYNQHN